MKYGKILIVILAFAIFAILMAQGGNGNQNPSPVPTSTPVSDLVASSTESDVAMPVGMPAHEPNFVSKAYGVSFWYPAGWTLSEHDPNRYVYTETQMRSSRIKTFAVSDGQGHEVAVSVSKEKSTCFTTLGKDDRLRTLSTNNGKTPVAVRGGPAYEYGADVYFIDVTASQENGSRVGLCGYEQGDISYSLTYFFPYTETLSLSKQNEMDEIVSSMTFSIPTKPVARELHVLADDVKTWKVYTDPTYGFNLKYPTEYGPFLDVSESYREYKPEVVSAKAASSTVSVAGEHLGGLSVQIYPLDNYTFKDVPGGGKFTYDAARGVCLVGDSGFNNDKPSEYTIKIAGVTACGVGTGDAGYAFNGYAIPDKKNNIMIEVGISYEPGYYQSVDLKSLLTTFKFGK